MAIPNALQGNPKLFVLQQEAWRTMKARDFWKTLRSSSSLKQRLLQTASASTSSPHTKKNCGTPHVMVIASFRRFRQVTEVKPSHVVQLTAGLPLQMGAGLGLRTTTRTAWEFSVATSGWGCRNAARRILVPLKMGQRLPNFTSNGNGWIVVMVVLT